MTRKSPNQPATFAGNSREVFRRVTEDDLSSLLRTLTSSYGARPATLIQKEVADLIGIGTSQCSDYVRSGRIPAHHFLTIALKAFAIGDPALIESILPKGYSLAPMAVDSDQTCEQAELEEISALDAARLAKARGDKRSAKKHLAIAKKELAIFEREVTE